MKTQSKIFVLFLFAFGFISANSWAQTYSIEPQNEQEAGQDAYRLGVETQRNQPVVTDFQKGESRSTDALHWTAVEAKQQSQTLPTIGIHPVYLKKVTPVEISTDNQIAPLTKSVNKSAGRSR